MTDQRTLTCTECGSQHLLIRSWIDLQSGDPVDGPTNLPEDVHCVKCDAEVDAHWETEVKNEN